MTDEANDLTAEYNARCDLFASTFGGSSIAAERSAAHNRKMASFKSNTPAERARYLRLARTDDRNALDRARLAVAALARKVRS